MEARSSPRLQKWIRKCVRREFESVIEESVEASEACPDIVEKIIHSRQMSGLLDTMRNTVAENNAAIGRSESTKDTGSRPETSLSFASDLTSGEWDPKDGSDDLCGSIIEKISRDKPVHVRLSGYEILLNSEVFASARDGPCRDVLLRALVDGVADENRSVFEASLQAHAKLLHYLEGGDVFANLLSAFNGQYYSRNSPSDSLPTLISGVNCRLFSHEKLFRIMHLAIRFQEEMLKTSGRNGDRAAGDVIEKFVIFLSTHSFGNALHPETLTALNVLAVLDPQADWSRKWMHGLKVRKVFVGALARSPSLLQQAWKAVGEGMADASTSRTLSTTCNDPLDARITGNVVETLTYLHCLSLLAQLCNCEAGRGLLSQSSAADTEFSVSDFVADLFGFLNKLATLQLSQQGLYVACSRVFELLLLPSTSLRDIRLHRLTSESLLRCTAGDFQVIWPHVLHAMMRIMSTEDGFLYMISKGERSPLSDCPAVNLVKHTATLLEQPFSMINTECVLASLRVVEKLFDACHAYEVIHDVVETDFFSALSQFYSKLDNYFVESEAKTQRLDRALRQVLLKVASVPCGMLALSREPLLFEELIRGTIAPLRASWDTHVASFVSSATYFERGREILADLAPHVLTTLLSDTCEPLLDPLHFHEPWRHRSSSTFLHIFALFGLNLKCLTAFAEVADEPTAADCAFPRNLRQLLLASLDCHSVYHQLALLSLNSVLWNLNVCLYFTHSLNFQEEFLQFQASDSRASETGEEVSTSVQPVCIIDGCTFIRSKILRNWRSIRYKYGEHRKDGAIDELGGTMGAVEESAEKGVTEDSEIDASESDSGLGRFLRESKPGLRDSNWLSQARELYGDSDESVKEDMVINLLEQMENAIPTAEWVDCFKWDDFPLDNEDFWFPEEWHGIELTLRYAEQWQDGRGVTLSETSLKQWFRTAYGFIKYTKPNTFDGFDWFLSTVCILCGGDLDKCKTFVTRFIRLHSSIYVWPVLGKVIDRNNNEEGVTQFVFNHLLESVVGWELPHIRYALESTSGSNWWQICNTMAFQCFWGLLPWHEIINYFVICILYPPDYMLYYCVSLLHHSQNKLMKDIANRRTWPEHMILDDYHCQDYVRLMDTLGKRYSNKVLPVLTLRKIYNTFDGI